MAYSYPILLDLTGKLVVIVGGGKVAVRKAKGVLAAEKTRIKCIAPEIDSEMPAEVERVHKEFQPPDLDGAWLVMAATNSPEVNALVVRVANQRRMLVCRVDGDDDDGGDFSVPAVWRSGRLIVTVNTGIPSLSAALRDELRNTFWMMEKYGEMAEVLRELRRQLYISNTLKPETRVEVLADLSTRPALDVLSNQGREGLIKWLIERYPRLGVEKLS